MAWVICTKKIKNHMIPTQKVQSLFSVFAFLLFEGIMSFSLLLPTPWPCKQILLCSNCVLHWHWCSWLISGKICMDLIAGVKLACFIYCSRIKEEAVVQEIWLVWNSEHRDSSPIFWLELAKGFCSLFIMQRQTNSLNSWHENEITSFFFILLSNLFLG